MNALRLLCCFVVVSLALGDSGELRIRNSTEFIAFINDESSYSGTTVYLESDIDFTTGFSGFVPKSSFNGVFDGQGCIISNLAVTSSLPNIGIFGSSSGGTFKNVIIESSCSFTSNYAGNEDVHIGSIIGYHNSNDATCIIHNIMNMANLTFEGSINDNNAFLYFGGIAGRILTQPYSKGTIKNCINYGSLTYKGTSSYAYIGGIAGLLFGSSSYAYVCNSLWNGTISYEGTSGTLYIGGIVGKSEVTSVLNCLSVGKTVSYSTGMTKVMGNVVGYAGSTVKVEHCLWTSDTNCDIVSGTGSPSTTRSNLVTMSKTIIEELNNEVNQGSCGSTTVSCDGWNEWLFDHCGGGPFTFRINNRKSISFRTKMTLLLDVAEVDDLTFSGWYSDDYYAKDPSLGLLCSCSWSSLIRKTVCYFNLCSLYGKIFNVTFDATGGKISDTSKKVAINSTYGVLPSPSGEKGYTFLGWFTENGKHITSETIASISDNHTLY